MSTDNISYFLEQNDKKQCVPCSYLDHVLSFRGQSYDIKYYSFLDGSEVNEHNVKDFANSVKLNIINKEYPTTDHLFTSIEIYGLRILYVSLDNSVRANINEFPLYKRLTALCRVLNKCLTDDDCIVFFSESCRPSFDGNNIETSPNKATWFSIREQIFAWCELEYLGECANNDDPNCMSFGVSAFCKSFCKTKISDIIPRRIWKEGFGSGALGVRLTSGEIVWGVHYPIDFRNIGPNNSQYKTTEGLVDVMNTYKGSVLAIGDFNTIPGNPINSVTAAIPDNMELSYCKFPTFYGAFYDVVNPQENEVWESYP